jgi:hypothetical protein
VSTCNHFLVSAPESDTIYMIKKSAVHSIGDTKNRFYPALSILLLSLSPSPCGKEVIAAPWGWPTAPLVVTTVEGSCRRRCPPAHGARAVAASTPRESTLPSPRSHNTLALDAPPCSRPWMTLVSHISNSADLKNLIKNGTPHH